MSLPKNITFYVEDGCLIPYGEVDKQLFDEQYGSGEIVETQVPPMHKKFHAILSKVIKERSPSLPWETVEELADALKRAAGATFLCETFGGKSYLATVSINQIKDFPSFFKKAMDVLANYLKVDVDTLTGKPAPEDPAAREARHDEAVKAMRDQPEPKQEEPWEYSRRGCMQKMLQLAEDKRFQATDENRQRLEAIVKTWQPYVGYWAEKCAQAAWDVKAGILHISAAKRLLEAQVDSVEKDHPGRAG